MINSLHNQPGKWKIYLKNSDSLQKFTFRPTNCTNFRLKPLHMKRITNLFVLLITMSFLACKSSSKTTTNEKPLEETLDEKNKQVISLLNRIRKIPGVMVRSGVPIFVKGNNSVESSSEPLYILNDYTVGNSFKSVNGLVQSVDIEKIEALSPADASLYGSRAGNGVIKITTYQ